MTQQVWDNLSPFAQAILWSQGLDEAVKSDEITSCDINFDEGYIDFNFKLAKPLTFITLNPQEIALGNRFFFTPNDVALEQAVFTAA